MSNQRVWIPIFLAAAVLAAAGAARAAGAAGEPPEKEKVVKKVRVMVVGGEGEREGEGSHYVFRSGDGETVHFEGGPGYAFFEETARRGYLGVELVELTPELRAHFGVPEEAGVMVARVEPGSPAAEAGLLVGDVVTAIGEETVAASRDLRQEIRGLAEGDRVALAVYRGGRRLSLTATIVERERAEVDVRRLLRPFAHPGEGPGGPGGPHVYQLDEEALGEALREAEQTWPLLGRMRVLHGLEGDLGQRIEKLEQRIEELERELARERRR